MPRRDDIITIEVNGMLAAEIQQWAEDEMALWPADTMYQDDLRDLAEKIKKALEKRDNQSS